MQRASFLSVLRGPDGRALGLPLAILLLVGLVANGVIGGAAAFDNGSLVICGTAPVDGDGALPGGAGHADCCVSGCCPVILGLLALALLALFAPQTCRRSVPGRLFRFVPSPRFHASARGPPFGLSHA